VQVVEHGAQAVAAATTLSQQEKNNSADVQRKRAKFGPCEAMNYPGAPRPMLASPLVVFRST
jgi:hypothetical protein